MARLNRYAANVPPGAVEAFAMDTPPRGWLKANGAAVLRSDYPRLFAAIGTTHGAGDGATTFNLPDLRGEFLRGLDDGRGVDSGRGLGTGQGDENKSHGHGATASTEPHHNHRQGLGAADGGRYGSEQTGQPATVPAYQASSGDARGLNTSNSGGHGTSVSIDNSGGSESRPRNVAMLYAIKT